MEMTEISKALTLTYHPNPVSPVDGRVVRPFEWREGETVRQHLLRAGFDPYQEIVVSLGEHLLTVEEWDTVTPLPGDILNVQVAVSGGGGGSNPVKIVAMIALAIVAPQIATSIYATMGGTFVAANAGLMIAGIGMAVQMAGSALIGAMFSPSEPSSSAVARSGAGKQESPTYSLSGGSNRARPYEPMPVVLGSHRVFPDYSSKPYTEYVGNDQYLYQVFNFSIGNDDLTIEDIRIGETTIDSFDDVELKTQNPDGSLDGFYGNVDATSGAELTHAADWVTRTTADNTEKIAIDIECVLFSVNQQSGAMESKIVTLNIEYRPVGSTTWLPFIPDNVQTYEKYWSRGYYEQITESWSYDSETGQSVPATFRSVWKQVAYDNNLSPTAHVDGEAGPTATVKGTGLSGTRTVPTKWRYVKKGSYPRPKTIFTYNSSKNQIQVSNAATKPKRLTITREVVAGQYEVRAKKVTKDTTLTNESNSVSWSTIKSYQANSGWDSLLDQKLLGVKIKASGQLNGVVQQLSALVHRTTPIWKNGAWAVEGTVNPAWWYLHFARGFRGADGRLLYGCGLSDNQIDIEAIKAWAAFCDTEQLTFSLVLDRAQSCAEVLQSIARVGFGSPSWATGKLGVVWDARNQTPVMAFGMSNICRGSFEVAYVSEDLPEEIVVPYLDKADGWTQKEVRVLVPGVTWTPKRTTQVDVPGLISNGVALKFARHVAADQEYRRRVITWETDFEGFVCQRGDVVLLSHDLTQWGYSGRVAGVTGNIIELDRLVPNYTEQTYLMLKRPDGQMTTYTIVPTMDDFLDQEQDYVDPDYCAAYIEPNTGFVTLSTPPSLQEGYELMDHTWFYAPYATPGKKVKIVSVQPTSESRVRIVATDEDPAIYTAWDGVWTDPQNASLLVADRLAKISSLSISETLVPTGTGYIVSLNVTIAASGAYAGATMAYSHGDIPIAKYDITGRDDTISVPSSGIIKVTATPIDAKGRACRPVTVEHTLIGLEAAVAFNAPTGISINPMVGCFSVTVDTPAHRMFTGLDIYASKTPDFTPSTANRVFHGPSNQGTVFALADGTPITEGMQLYLHLSYWGNDSVAAPVYSDEINFVMPSSATSKLLMLTASSQVLKIAQSGAASPASTTFTAVLAGGLTGAVTFEVTSGTATLVGTGSSRTLAAPDMTTDAVTVRAYVTSGGATYEDSVTVAKVNDGSSAVSMVLTNESQTLPANSSGTVTSYVGASTNVLVYLGAVDDSANWTISKADSSGVSSSLSGRTVTVSGLTADSGYVDITATKAGASITKRFSLNKSKDGSSGTSGSNGTRGNITITATGSSWSDTTANNAIYNATGSYTKVFGDTVTISNGSTFGETRYWTGSAWTTAAAYINGNLIVNGGVYTKNMASSSISQAFSGEIYPSGALQTTGTVFTMPSISGIEDNGILYITVTSMWQNVNTAAGRRVQALHWVNNSQSGDAPIMYIEYGVANSNFYPVGPTSVTSGNCALVTTMERISVSAGSSVSISVEGLSTGAGCYCAGASYTAFLLKR